MFRVAFSTGPADGRAAVASTVTWRRPVVDAASASLGVLLALPATAALAQMMGSLSFRTPLLLLVGARGATVAWTAAVLLVSFVASDPGVARHAHDGPGRAEQRVTGRLL